MRQIVTKGIVLSRTDFGEADRILTVLTPDEGKISLMAKGVRKIKSKLAGGIELFSISSITFIPGRGEVGTLISSRLDIHFSNIVRDINRTMLGYDMLKLINRVTEDMPGPEYFDILTKVLEGLDNADVSQELIQLWLYMHLLKLTGHTPNLKTDKLGERLESGEQYTFDLDDILFLARKDGRYGAQHIKLLRLAIGLEEPAGLAQIKDAEAVLAACLQLALNMTARFIRI
jgi:DNA repair protein RecO